MAEIYSDGDRAFHGKLFFSLYLMTTGCGDISLLCMHFGTERLFSRVRMISSSAISARTIDASWN